MFASYTWEPWKSSGCFCKVPRSSVDEKREFSQLSCPAPVKREQELHESWWELRSKSLHQSFFSPVKRCVRWELTGYCRAGGENTHQFSSEFKPAQSWWNLIGGRARDTTLISQSQSHVYEEFPFEEQPVPSIGICMRRSKHNSCRVEFEKKFTHASSSTELQT